jgi:hypothetical protein
MKFPKHKCGLHLTHNAHKDYYEPIAEYVQHDYADCFKDEEEKKRAVDTDEIWEIQWYPNTPVGFNKVAAPTLEEVLALALEVEAC